MSSLFKGLPVNMAFDVRFVISLLKSVVLIILFNSI